MYKLDLILSKLNILEDRFDSMETKFENRSQSVETKFESMEQKMELIEMQLEENTQITRAIRTRQEKAAAKLEALPMDVHHIKGEVTKLSEGISRQEKILESLSIRYMEHDSEIRDLKRIK